MCGWMVKKKTKVGSPNLKDILSTLSLPCIKGALSSLIKFLATDFWQAFFSTRPKSQDKNLSILGTNRAFKMK